MPTDAFVLAPLLLAVVLAVSAVAKLRAPEESAEAFTALRVPRALSRPWAVRGLPWAELGLAVALVVLPGALGVVAAVAAVALFGAYLWLVVRARGFETDVDCACFGAFGPGSVTRLTVWRNAWLLLLAVTAVVVAADGQSVVGRVADGAAPWWWLAGALAGALTAGLVLGVDASGQRGGEAPVEPVGAVEGGAMAVEEGDYLRSRTPAVPVTLGDGTTTELRELSRLRPQLLVYVSETCGSCSSVIDSVPGWRDAMPQVDVRLVLRTPPGTGTLTQTAEPLSVHDVDGYVHGSFGLRTPSAILLGADGLLAGGPVIGSFAVPEFVDDILAELGSPE